MERETALDVGEGLQWVTHVPTDLDPGLYRVEVRVNGTQRGRPLYDYAIVRFEVRARSPEARPELLRREAYRRLTNDDHVGAREIAAELLKVHPNSTQAYVILETIAIREGNRAEAATQKGRREAIVKSGLDKLLLKYGKWRIVD